jgi:ABC-type dipeptide/oligopeptide/nickel transport system permease subunit
MQCEDNLSHRRYNIDDGKVAHMPQPAPSASRAGLTLLSAKRHHLMGQPCNGADLLAEVLLGQQNSLSIQI